MRLRWIALPAFCIAFAGGCAPSYVAPQSAAPTATAAPLTGISDRLYFGRSIPGGGTVSEDSWDGFLRDVVTARFPSGLTVWRAQGQWRTKDGVVVREESFVLELIHSADAESEASIQAIVNEYKRRFKQEAVLRVRGRVEVSY